MIAIRIEELDMTLTCSIDLEQVFVAVDRLVEATKNDERWGVMADTMKVLEEHYKKKKG